MKHFKQITAFCLILLLASSVFAADKIKIGSWNIQNFGISKANDEAKMEIIGKILSQFDIIAVQEISNVYEKSDAGCPRNENSCPGNKNCDLLLNALKAHLSNSKDYELMFSPQVKDERYLFIYDRNKVEAMDSGQLAVDPEDNLPVCDTKSEGKMARQPFYATFKAGKFDFVLMTAHTSPSNNVAELQSLSAFYKRVQSDNSPQKDVILLGDLNADCSYLKKSMPIDFRRPEYTWVIEDNTDTTVGTNTCTYDRMIFTKETTKDYTGNHGVFRFDSEYHLSSSKAKGISDHYPIWAEFYTNKDTDH